MPEHTNGINVAVYRVTPSYTSHPPPTITHQLHPQCLHHVCLHRRKLREKRKTMESVKEPGSINVWEGKKRGRNYFLWSNDPTSHPIHPWQTDRGSRENLFTFRWKLSVIMLTRALIPTLRACKMWDTLLPSLVWFHLLCNAAWQIHADPT